MDIGRIGSLGSIQAPALRAPLAPKPEAGPCDGLGGSVSTALPGRPVFQTSPEVEVEVEVATPKELPRISDDQRLLQPGAVVWELQPGWGHSKARSESGKDYPARGNPPQTWQQADPDYQPTFYEAPVLATQPAWADPADMKEALSRRQLTSYEPRQLKGAQGEPLNPRGPTGIAGRGLLGKFGANFAADPIVTRTHPETGKLEMIAIVREDLNQVAIPGGMVDPGEKISGTLARELCEETLGKEEHGGTTAQEKELQTMFERATPVYRGYVDDPRNTDNSWMETSAFHLHLNDEEAARLNLQKGSDAAAVSWKEITAESLGQMYGSHGAFVKQAVLLWQKESGLVVGQDGTVGKPA
ncbi:MAG: NUDIX domain-containing protein [Candidatus Eremiobacteraeota bacterium]|nr:NUDIX domain-containing protein [Candidatus Eremiobacteraeota bacterium]MCW5869695.1 NUDIX domain-containing protein [Candidatus Eremiobacteraeota bacterium]